ncbi:MAG: PD-(D/E)XK nuclease family protein, partial [Gammaproteobacteria bacterium]
TVKLKELLIKIKIDRVDQVNNGSDLNLLIIDYKTGKSLINNHNWQDPRIDDPQLLIYSLCLANIEELILAAITASPKFITLSNWQELKDVWYESLYKLAKDFQNGVAIVDPKYGAITCRQCDLKYMCRVFE